MVCVELFLGEIYLLWVEKSGTREKKGQLGLGWWEGTWEKVDEFKLYVEVTTDIKI